VFEGGTWTDYPSEAPFTPVVSGCYLIFSFLCNILYIIVCSFSFDRCIVCSSFDAIDLEFKPRSVKTKSNRNWYLRFSAKHASLRSKSNDWFSRCDALCVTYLHSDCCFNELVLYTSNWMWLSSTKLELTLM
jgi:hypothetical protein